MTESAAPGPCEPALYDHVMLSNLSYGSESAAPPGCIAPDPFD